jgi:hypothetical protein
MESKEHVTLIELKKLNEASDKIAREIRMISRSFKAMASHGLRREALVVLIHNSSNVNKTEIRSVLVALDRLESEYLMPETNQTSK